MFVEIHIPVYVVSVIGPNTAPRRVKRILSYTPLCHINKLLTYGHIVI